MRVKEIQLDVAKPKDVDLEEIAKEIAKSLDATVKIKLAERNIHTDDISIVVTSDDLDVKKASQFIESLGLRIRSIDGIVVSNE